MLLNNKSATQDKSANNGAFISSGIMAFAGLGDAVLYPILPVYAERMEIPVLWVSILLSVNRFVRIISNTWMANMIHKLGMKRIVLVTSILSVVTTLTYGLHLGLMAFLIMRILWGISYSGLKIATLGYASMVKLNGGYTFGISKSLKSLGALFALWIGPKLFNAYGMTLGFVVLALLSCVGVMMAFKLPNIMIATNRIRTMKTFALTPLNLLVNILAMSIDGILVVVLARIFYPTYQQLDTLLVMVAFYLLLKRLSTAIFSFLGGLISHKISAHILFNTSVVLCVISLLFIAFGYAVTGVVLVFIFNAIVVTFSPLLSMDADEGNPLQAISGVSTWWDVGAAIGTFVGLLLVDLFSVKWLFLLLAGAIFVFFINFILYNGSANQSTV